MSNSPSSGASLIFSLKAAFSPLPLSLSVSIAGGMWESDRALVMHCLCVARTKLFCDYQSANPLVDTRFLSF